MAWNKSRYDQGCKEAGMVWTRNNNDMDLLEREYDQVTSVDEYEVGFRVQTTTLLATRDKKRAARFHLRATMDATYMEQLSDLEAKGCYWKVDPEFPMVVGLMCPKCSKVFVIVYLDEHDSEEAEDFWCKEPHPS